jgi:phage head maturation protease
MKKKLNKTNTYIRDAAKRNTLLQVSVATSSAVEGVRVKTFDAMSTTKSSLRKAVRKTAAASSK